MWFWILPIACGLIVYAMELFWNRAPEKWVRINHLTMAIGLVLIILGVRSMSWAVCLSTAIVWRLTYSAVWVVALGVSGLLTGLLSGLSLLCDGSSNSWSRYTAKDRFHLVVFPATMFACLLLSPVFVIPNGSLVAENGRILPFGDNYNFRLFSLSSKVGLDNPARASVIKSVKSRFYGEKEMEFDADISLDLKPGDRLPQDFNWYAFRTALNQWFTGRLDNRFVPEPVEGSCKVAGLSFDRCYTPIRSVGNQEFGIVMGIPVTWSGRYSFR
jgi:hypothetical protein